jgi:hypothetical protein
VPARWLAMMFETSGGAAFAEEAKAQIIDKRRSLVFIFLGFICGLVAWKPLLKKRLYSICGESVEKGGVIQSRTN